MSRRNEFSSAPNRIATGDGRRGAFARLLPVLVLFVVPSAAWAAPEDLQRELRNRAQESWDRICTATWSSRSRMESVNICTGPDGQEVRRDRSSHEVLLGGKSFRITTLGGTHEMKIDGEWKTREMPGGLNVVLNPHYEFLVERPGDAPGKLQHYAETRARTGSSAQEMFLNSAVRSVLAHLHVWQVPLNEFLARPEFRLISSAAETVEGVALWRVELKVDQEAAGGMPPLNAATVWFRPDKQWAVARALRASARERRIDNRLCRKGIERDPASAGSARHPSGHGSAGRPMRNDDDDC